MNEPRTPDNDLLNNRIEVLEDKLAGIQVELAERNGLVRDLRRLCNDAELARDHHRASVQMLRTQLDGVRGWLVALPKNEAIASSCERLLARIDSVMKITA